MLVAAGWTVEGIAPLMTPWCSERDVPTSAHLNTYGQEGSAVGWHSDDEPLFGCRGDSNRIVSLSFGSSSSFKWKAKVQDFVLCMDPGEKQERINVMFRGLEPHAASFLSTPEPGVVCCVPACAKGSFVLGAIGGAL